MFSFRRVFDVVKPAEKVLSLVVWARRLSSLGVSTPLETGLHLPVSLRQLLAEASLDTDLDGLPDFWEQTLAERFAPILYHSSDESNWPTNVDWFLARTALWFYDDASEPDTHRICVESPDQAQLLKCPFHRPVTQRRQCTPTARGASTSSSRFIFATSPTNIGKEAWIRQTGQRITMLTQT